MRMQRFWVTLASALAGLAAAVPAGAQPAAAPAVAATTPALTPADAEVWLAGFMPYALKTGDVAGAVVVVVKDGVVVAENGYGYADVATKRPVDPKATLFRPGSTSKLFTWTAVMQQVELGRLDLDRDVNTYLDFKIPPYRGQPVTLRQIMTHTAGFEEALSGLMGQGPTAPPLDAVLKKWVPKRIFAPGTTPAYSNYATALAGYMVQRVSGEPYDDYIAHHIFEPLGMWHSTMREPLPPELAPLMSRGYARASQPAKPFEIITVRPAGSGTSSGDDMAKFMIAHLNEDNNPLLRPATARLMHNSALTLVPPLNRMELGFYEANLNGRRIIAHGGDTQWFHTYLWLLPDEKTGVFFSMNSAGQGLASLTLREGLIQAFMDRYYPAAAPASTGFQARPADAAAIAGTYVGSRRSQSGVRRALNFFGQFTVTADAAGKIHIPGFEFAGLNGAPRDWVEIAPFVWQDRYGSERLAAVVEHGKAVRLAIDSFSPFTVYDRVPWWQSKAWLGPALPTSMLLLLGLVLSAPFGWLARKYYGGERRLAGRERQAYLTSVWLALAAVVAVGVWVSILVSLKFTPLGPPVYALEIATIALLPLLCLATASFLLCGLEARRNLFSLLLRLAVLLASVCVLWAAVAFNLIHIGLDY